MWAMERAAAARSPRSSRALARLGIHSVHVVEGDGRTYDFPMPFDRVLVDAPCSGLGVLGRRADARWRKQPDLFARAAAAPARAARGRGGRARARRRRGLQRVLVRARGDRRDRRALPATAAQHACSSRRRGCCRTRSSTTTASCACCRTCTVATARSPPASGRHDDVPSPIRRPRTPRTTTRRRSPRARNRRSRRSSRAPPTPRPHPSPTTAPLTPMRSSPSRPPTP